MKASIDPTMQLASAPGRQPLSRLNRFTLQQGMPGFDMLWFVRIALFHILLVTSGPRAMAEEKNSAQEEAAAAI